MGARAALALALLLALGALSPAYGTERAQTAAGTQTVQAVLDARVAALGGAT